MTTLALYIYAAMTAFVPLSAHSSFEAKAVTESRYESIAADVARASEEQPVVEGDPARTGVLLAAIAAYESAFAARVADCSTPGGKKGERAWSLWQVEGPKADLCASTLSAARIAVRMVGESLHGCRSEPLAIYTTGTCRKDDKARWRLSRARRWWTANVFDSESET